MKVDISDITKVNGMQLELDFKEKPGNASELVEGYVLDEPVSFKGRLTNINGILELDGRFITGYRVTCYRCLKDMKGTLDVKLFESIVNSTSSDIEPDAYIYTGNMLDLGKIVYDNIILNLPMKQICTRDCKGLCQRCGANLNEEPCNCSEDSMNPHMESLRNFFDN